MISASKFSYNGRLTCKFVSFTLLLGTLTDDSVTNMLDFRARKGCADMGNTNIRRHTDGKEPLKAPCLRALDPEQVHLLRSQGRKEGCEQMAALFLKDRQ